MGIFALTLAITIVAAPIFGAKLPIMTSALPVAFGDLNNNTIEVVIQILAYVYFSIATAVAYYQLRRVKEGIGVDDIAAVLD